MTPHQARPVRSSFLEIFLTFLRLGCTSFGGPVAHLGYFRKEFVERRQWLSDGVFAELVALAQSMPGPASSQVGFAMGLLRGGLPGAIAAWLGFTLPSALLMLVFAFGHNAIHGRIAEGVLHGLQLVAVGVIAQAILAMQKTLAPNRPRLMLAIVATGLALFAPASIGIELCIVVGAVAGVVLLRAGEQEAAGSFTGRVSPVTGAVAACVFAVLLITSLSFRGDAINGASIGGGFFRAGALVFGGGHVVLPLLSNVVVDNGWMPQPAFLSGYGAAQALPGPLFSFAAYLGAAVRPNPHPLLFGIEALVAIFLPGLLIMTAVIPFWTRLRERRLIRAAIKGINASVVGVLIAALYQPVWTGTVHSGVDFWIALSVFSLLTLWKAQPWIVVLGAGALSGFIEFFR